MWTGQQLEEVKLCMAALESLHTGRITPLLKEELKYQIQSRRMSEGKKELVVDFNSTVSTAQELRADEIEKNVNRREQNRRASQKFRNKKKSEINDTQKAYRELLRRNVKLKKDLAGLQMERDCLHEQVMSAFHTHHPNSSYSTAPCWSVSESTLAVD